MIMIIIIITIIKITCLYSSMLHENKISSISDHAFEGLNFLSRL